jgi:hypothetical protein
MVTPFDDLAWYTEWDEQWMKNTYLSK